MCTPPLVALVASPVQFASWAGARVIGTASLANHDYVRHLGADPVAYGDNLVARVRGLAPDGASVIIDLVGGDALEASLDLGSRELRLVSVTNPDRVKALGGSPPMARSRSEFGRRSGSKRPPTVSPWSRKGTARGRLSSCSTSDP